MLALDIAPGDLVERACIDLLESIAVKPEWIRHDTPYPFPLEGPPKWQHRAGLAAVGLEGQQR